MMSSAPTIHRLSIPNPFFEGRNSVYVIETDAITLVDTGVATDKANDFLCAGLGELGFQASDVAQVVLTHKHIDHIGNAWRFQQMSGASVWIHETEVTSVRNVDPAGGHFRELMFERMREWQVPQAELPEEDAEAMPTWQLEGAEAIAFQDDDRIDVGGGHELQVIHTPGHSMGSSCLRCGDHIFSGDHVLPTISPNVGAGDLQQRGMLQHFLESLDRIEQYDGSTVYPGHGLPFNHLAERCRELRVHHNQRLDKIREIVDGQEKTVFEVAVELFGQLNGIHVLLGCAEANAHLEWLMDAGEIAAEGPHFGIRA